MKNLKKRKYNSPVLEGSFSKKHGVSKKHKADVSAHENQLPVDWYKVKIILDATVVEKYLNKRKSGSKILPPQQETNNVTVKLDVPEFVRVDDNLSPEDSLDIAEVTVKQELNHLDNDTLYDKELQNCYQEVTIAQESENALINEVLFVGQEVEHEESIPSFENGEEIIKKSTRSRKRKKSLDLDNCNHGLAKKSRVPSHNKGVTSKLHIKEPKTCSGKSKTPLKMCKPKPNQKSSIVPKPRKTKNQVLYCDHCDYKGRRAKLINHFHKKHPHLLPNDSMRCPNCDTKFTSWEAMQSHRPRCLLSLICKVCLVDVPAKRTMQLHVQALHPERIGDDEDDDKILDELSRYSLTSDIQEMQLTPFEQRYLEIRRYLEMESELVKLYCPKCAVTRDKIMNKIAPCCDGCKSRMLFQCQKCKDTRYMYGYIWKHFTNKNSYCSIFRNLPFSNEEEPESTTDQGNPNKHNHYDCGICDFSGATKTQLCNHVVSAHLDSGMKKDDHSFCSKCGASFLAANVRRLKRHEEFCGVITILFPCRFCPISCDSTKKLSVHIAIMHLDELDGRNISEFLEEALNFKKLVKELNCETFNDKFTNGEAVTARDYYKGIESILKPVCIECKTDGSQDGERCTKCQATLNFVCLECDELFSKYSVAWVHATRLCENRKFTLNIEKTCEYPAIVDLSTTSKELFYCDHCIFKNASKSILRYHMKQTHPQSYEIQGRFTCSKCYQNFDNAGFLFLHRQQCRMGFEYSCPFCEKSSRKFRVIEKHITKNHDQYIPGKDTLDEILQMVIEKKRSRTKKTNNRYDKFGQLIRRKFSENVKLATFYCPECNEKVDKNFTLKSDTRTCPKCNAELSMQCKVCSRSFSTWTSIRYHFQMTKCGGEIEACDVDHPYSIGQSSPEVTKSLIVEGEDGGCNFFVI